MVEYEETSSLQVLGTVTADATITVFFGLFSFDGSIHDALFPKGLFSTQLAAAATLLDVLVMLLVRATLAASAVTGTRQCTSRYGLILVFSMHCAMAIWYDTGPEHSLCVAWAATFRGESWIELSQYRGAILARQRTMQGRSSPAQEPLLPHVAPNTQDSVDWDPLQ